MTLFNFEKSKPGPAVLQTKDLDFALSAQLIVAWAGEKGEEPRLGWWRSDLVSEFGGEDLFQRLLPTTWRWAVFQGAREAARRKDAELRAQDHNPDRILSLFSLGFERDEALEERFQDLKRSGKPPQDCLEALAQLTDPGWKQERFWGWIDAQGQADSVSSSLGRRLKGAPPASLTELIKSLLANLAPPAAAYPLPHFRLSE